MPRAKATDTPDAKETKPKKKVALSKAGAPSRQTRAKTTASAQTVAKKTTAKKPASKTAAKTTARRRGSAATQPAKTQKTPVSSAEDTQVRGQATSPASTKSRKAPTTFANQEAAAKTKRKQQVVVVGLVLVGIVASAAVGFSDTQAGQIDVAQTIQARNQRMANMVDVNGPVTVGEVSDVPAGNLANVPPPAPLGAPRATPAAIKPKPPTVSASSTPQVAGADTSTTTSNMATTTKSVQVDVEPKIESLVAETTETADKPVEDTAVLDGAATSTTGE